MHIKNLVSSFEKKLLSYSIHHSLSKELLAYSNSFCHDMSNDHTRNLVPAMSTSTPSAYMTRHSQASTGRVVMEKIKSIIVLVAPIVANDSHRTSLNFIQFQ